MLKNKKITAVICEFNPLHKGHKYLIDTIKANSLLICVMSGNFVQRGDCAIYDKWTRTKMALGCGADLVLELPMPVATSNAQMFANSSLEIISSLGIVDELCFGSECGDVNILNDILDIFETSEYENLLKINLQKGKSFATTREETVREIMGKTYNGELSGSNNNLALEYMQAIRNQKLNIIPKSIKRVGANHDEIANGEFLSAMQIRDKIKNQEIFENNLPPESIKHLRDETYNIDKLEIAILSKLRTLSIKDISKLPDISEGIENKIFKSIKISRNLEELISNIKSKRYTHARIRRIILHAFLSVTKEMQTVNYVKILGMNENGKEIIKESKKNLPIIGKIKDVDKIGDFAKKQFELECQADDIFALAKNNIDICGRNYTNGVIIHKNLD